MERRPQSVNILGVEYAIQYVDKPSEVDIFRRESLWGQVDCWTRTIRVYDDKRSDADVFQTLTHEVLHAIGEQLHLTILTDKNNHDALDSIALALCDVLMRNGWVTMGDA